MDAVARLIERHQALQCSGRLAESGWSIVPRNLISVVGGGLSYGCPVRLLEPSNIGIL